MLSSSWRRFSSGCRACISMASIMCKRAEGVVVVAQDVEFYFWVLNEWVVFTIVVAERR